MDLASEGVCSLGYPRNMITENEQLVLDRDFPATRSNREDVIQFAQLQRGSIRLTLGLFRTEDEQDKFIEDGLNRKLPGATPCR